MCCKIISAEYGLLKRIMQDEGTCFISEKYKDFCNKVNTKQAVSYSYQHQRKGQVEVYLNVVKDTMKKCVDTILIKI